MQKRWQDYVGVVLGVLLFLSPWIIGYSAVTVAAASAWVFFGIALVKPDQWEEWVNLVLAVLLLLSPFVLGFTGTPGAAVTHWILAVLIGGDAIWALIQTRGQAHGTA